MGTNGGGGGVRISAQMLTVHEAYKATLYSNLLQAYNCRICFSSGFPIIGELQLRSCHIQAAMVELRAETEKN